jgi:pimeloyl-ACP methyl ester carboxylesterase
MEDQRPYLLLIHGFMEDSRIWEPQLANWSKKYRILAPDLPGFGRRVQEDFLGIEEEAIALWQWIDSMNIHQISIAGHSMGGYIGLAMAEQQHQRIAEFWLINSHACADGVMKQQNRTRLIELVKEKGTTLFLDGFHQNLFAQSNRERFESVTSILKERAKSIRPETVIQASLSMRDRPDRTSILSQLGERALFFVGTEDESIEPWQIDETSKCLPPTHIFVMQGVGHMAMYEYDGKS